jgi:hypothetical protein
MLICALGEQYPEAYAAFKFDWAVLIGIGDRVVTTGESTSTTGSDAALAAPAVANLTSSETALRKTSAPTEITIQSGRPLAVPCLMMAGDKDPLLQRDSAAGDCVESFVSLSCLCVVSLHQFFAKRSIKMSYSGQHQVREQARCCM